ncbi:MFS transporter [Actinoplanes siamensis]|uniref:hypothetical protein n=1 Tax=Actinoplanes siamensis TaxID=1223317 RepID=UPI00361437CB
MLDATSTLITALVIAGKVPETLAPVRRHDAPAGGMRTVLADRIFLAFVGLTILQALLNTQTNTIVPLAMHGDGLGPGDYGLVTALGGALIVIGQLFVPGFIDGRRKDRVLALSLVVMAAGFAVLTVADSLPAYLTAAVIWTTGGMLAAPPNAAIKLGAGAAAAARTRRTHRTDAHNDLRMRTTEFDERKILRVRNGVTPANKSAGGGGRPPSP